MEEKKTLPNLLETVKGYAKLRGRSLKKISLGMGKSPNYLTQKLKNQNPDILILLELSELLNLNLVEHYTTLLPPALQTTHRERALLIELEQLKKELLTLKAERDKYWEVISK